MISSNNAHVFVRDLRDLSSPVILDTWWASMVAGLNCSMAWNNSRHAASWHFYLDCGIDNTGSPGIMCIIGYQVVRHPSDHWTSSMVKPLVAKWHIAKLNKSTKLELTQLSSSTVD